MKSGRLTRAGAFYGLAFLTFSWALPHRHRNPLGDLISPGPSDSGWFWDARHLAAHGVALSAGGLVDDDPCLSCFSSDFRAAAQPASRLAVCWSWAFFTHRMGRLVYLAVEPSVHSRAPPGAGFARVSGKAGSCAGREVRHLWNLGMAG